MGQRASRANRNDRRGCSRQRRGSVGAHVGAHVGSQQMATYITSTRERENTAKGIVAGLIGGLIGSWTMNQFQALVAAAGESAQSNDSEKASPDEDSAEDEDATQRLAQTIAEKTIDRRLSKSEVEVAGPIVHYAYGTLTR